MSNRALLRYLLAAYCVFLALVLLNPSADPATAAVLWTWQRLMDLGLSPTLVTGSRVEFVLNVLILMPVSALGALVWRRTNWRDWTAYGFVVAFAVEATQALLLPHRSAAFSDVVANALGGLLGGLLGAPVSRLVVESQRPSTSRR